MCTVLEAEGHTFPVDAVFLEDVYRTIGYRLARDAPAAMRTGGARANANAMRKQAGGGNRCVICACSYVHVCMRIALLKFQDILGTISSCAQCQTLPAL
jgi:hypothetical protein